ncbi:hypothetical protein HDU76_011543, partial [Blyttiomyces sp. JEL0837]
MTAMSSPEYELFDPPSDGISSLQFSPSDPSQLLVGSWDKSVTLYDVESNRVKFQYFHEAPVLDVAFAKSSQAFSGGLDKQLKCVDLESETESNLGSHENAIRCVEYASTTGNVVTGGWDRKIKLWDPRSRKNAEISSHDQPEKIFSLDITHEKLVVAMAQRLVYIYDVRSMKEPIQKRESSLKFMTRIVRCMPDGEGYAASSIEGRVAVEFFDASEESQIRKYAFKCHRETIEGIDTVFPVNALAFHP